MTRTILPDDFTFIDWNDRNAHAAAECAIRFMGGHTGFDFAVAEAARMYSCDERDVKRWVRRIAGGRA